MPGLFLAHVVDDMIYFGFKIRNPSAIVQYQSDDDSDKHHGQHQTPSQAGIRCFFLSVDLCLSSRDVALFSGVSVAAHASLGRVANEISSRTVARFHAVITVEPFRTHLVASVSHPAGKADALAIVLSTLGFVFAAALLTTVWSVESVGTYRFAVGTGPPGRTLAHSRLVRTFAAIFAGTLQTTFRSVRIRRTGMFTRGSNIARSAAILSGYVITGGIAVHGSRATFLAAMAKESIRTGLITVCAGPAT